MGNEALTLAIILEMILMLVMVAGGAHVLFKLLDRVGVLEDRMHRIVNLSRTRSEVVDELGDEVARIKGRLEL